MAQATITHKACFVLTALALVFCAPRASANAPEESQLAGRIHAVLSAFIIAEFGGQTRASTHSYQRPVCEPTDYEVLQEATRDNAALMELHARCRLVETRTERMHVHGFAYLPAGYCDRIRSSIEAARQSLRSLTEEELRDRAKVQEVAGEHAGLRLGADFSLLRSSQSEITCQDDGSIRFTAQRNREPVRLYAEDVATMPFHVMIKDNLSTYTPIFSGIIIALLLSRWIAVLITTAIVGLSMHLLHFGLVLLSYPASFGDRWMLYVAATIGVYLFWATLFFMLKQLVARRMKGAQHV